MRFILTPDQNADVSQAAALVQNMRIGSLLADTGYDSDLFIAQLSESGIQAVIPPKANRIRMRKCDWWLYKERHTVECMFGKLKHYRRIFSRFEKTAINYMGMLALEAIMLWLR